MGSKPQTLSSWKKRGVRGLPAQRLLEALARVTRTPYEDVLVAALRDAGYLPRAGEHGGDTASIVREVSAEHLAGGGLPTEAGQQPPPGTPRTDPS